MDISVVLDDKWTLEHPIMNAAGTCKTLEQVEKLARSASSAIVVGSLTDQPRAGNSGEAYYTSPHFSLNSLGLPNGGWGYYRDNLLPMSRIAHDVGKPLIVSVAGFNRDEYLHLALAALTCGADFVELNLGCPNVWESGEQKRIPSLDPALTSSILDWVNTNLEIAHSGWGARVSVKVSPVSDPYTLSRLAKSLVYSDFEMVTACNTFPNGFAYDEKGMPAITAGNGLAGVAGPALKPISLGQVRQLREHLPPEMAIIGVGGIASGQDVMDYLRLGALAVQVGTAYLDRGEVVFSDILREYVEILEKGG